MSSKIPERVKAKLKLIKIYFMLRCFDCFWTLDMLYEILRDEIVFGYIKNTFKYVNAVFTFPLRNQWIFTYKLNLNGESDYVWHWHIMFETMKITYECTYLRNFDLIFIFNNSFIFSAQPIWMKIKFQILIFFCFKSCIGETN